MTATRLTTVFVERVQPPAKGQKDYYDAEMPGFGLRVSYGGTKTWCYWYRFAGKARRLSLGRWDRMTLAEARKAARDAYLQVREGVDPIEARKERQRATEQAKRDTFGAIAAAFLADHASKLKSARNTRYTIEAHLNPHWKDMPLDAIDRREIRRVVKSIKGSGAQNNAFKAARRVFNWAVDEGLRSDSPARGMKVPNVSAPRTGRLRDADEIRTFWRIADEAGYTGGYILKLLLVNGQREQQVMGVAKQELDYDALMWTIPPARVKRSRPGQAKVSHTVPLTPLAVELFREASKYSRNSYVFQSQQRPKTHVKNAQKPTARVRDEIPGFTVHNLRRTMSTIMRGELGVSLDIVRQILGHQPQGVTDRHYAQMHDEAGKRRALEAWDAWLRGVIKQGG